MISVVICTYNRERFITETLNCLKEQKMPFGEFEIVIVNNNSTDTTEVKCKEFIKLNPEVTINYVIEYNQGLSFARNRGIKEAKGDIITFIDDDAFAVASFLNTIKDFFDKSPDILAIGGKVVPKFEAGKPQWMSAFLMPLVAAIDIGNEIKEFKGKKFPIGANMSFRRSAFEKFGLFNTKLGRTGNNLLGSEEKDMFNRFKVASEKVFYVPGAEVEHVIPPSRTTEEYIRRQAIGIGASERMRVMAEGKRKDIEKNIQELFKVGATIILFLFYTFTLQLPKGSMLIKFRFWVLRGFYSLPH